MFFCPADAAQSRSSLSAFEICNTWRGSLGLPKCHPQMLHGQSAIDQLLLPLFDDRSFKVLISSSIETRRKLYPGAGPRARDCLCDWFWMVLRGNSTSVRSFYMLAKRSKTRSVVFQPLLPVENIVGMHNSIRFTVNQSPNILLGLPSFMSSGPQEEVPTTML